MNNFNLYYSEKIELVKEHLYTNKEAQQWLYGYIACLSENNIINDQQYKSYFNKIEEIE